MFSYAGVNNLSDPVGTEVGEWITANIRTETLFPIAYQSWPGQWFNGPVLNITPEVPQLRLNTLRWPHDASRFATGFFVASGDQLKSIRKVVYKYGSVEAAPLTFSDAGTTVTTDMWMLPPIPLSQANPQAEMYLIPLVDERYWWWGISVDLVVLEGSTLWTDLYDAIAVYLDIDIDVDPVNSAYGVPVAQYQTGARPLPLVFDAIAFSVGQRVVRYLDGSVAAQNPATSDAIITANLIGAAPYAGGEYNFDA